MRSRWAKYWYLGPAMLVVIATITYPLLSALITSFREWQLNESPEPGAFVGLENYQRVLQDAGFWNSVWVTVMYSVISVSITMVLALAIALVLQGPGRFKAVAKTMLILPYAVAPALKGFSWRFMLNENYGVYDTILDKVPFTQNIVWLGDPFWALVSIAMSEVWGWAPLIALMFIGALGSIDPEVQEAARVDGANGLQLVLPHHPAAARPGHPRRHAAQDHLLAQAHRSGSNDDGRGTRHPDGDPELLYIPAGFQLPRHGLRLGARLDLGRRYRPLYRLLREDDEAARLPSRGKLLRGVGSR